MNKIRNIIFDFGGVLYNIRYQNIAEAFARYGFADFENLYSKAHQVEAFDLFEEGRMSVSEFCDYVRSLSHNPLTDDQIAECWNAILIDFPTSSEQLLKKVRDHYRIFLFSNTNQLNYEAFTEQMIRKFGYSVPEKYMERCYYSQILHIRKPKPEGFQHILEENGLKAEETLFIDDSPQHIATAKQLGFQTHHLQPWETVNDLFDEDGYYKMENDRPNTLFLDRDGVLNERIVDGYVTRPEEFVLLPGVLEALRLLRSRFDRIVLVSNQQGIGKGLFSLEDLDKVHAYMQSLFKAQGTPLDAIYVCPHLASEHCDCRKPNVGMALQAKDDFPEIDLSTSIMVGDSLSDMQFAHNAGIRAVSVGPADAERDELAVRHYVDLLDFANNVDSLLSED
ncbi:MAG: HAD-IIIA family hydrolase [Bacteroidales bacterium]|nr:HAD-IIIA family hydrolase [Bacteroidales bacterium]